MDFKKLYSSRPHEENKGGSGYSRMKHLYDICFKLQPELIVESGSWKGNSSFAMHMASIDSKMICFDIDFSNLKWKSDKIKYVEHDIEQFDFSNYDLSDALIYFDDHIDQQRRVNWAIRKGFKRMIFDDNVDSQTAQTLKNPASPTLEMIGFKERYKPKVYEILPCLGDDNETYLTYIEV